MADRRLRPPPRWLFAIIMVGSFLACGIYLGLIRAEGPAPEHVVRAAVYGVVGLLTLRGALGQR